MQNQQSQEEVGIVGLDPLGRALARHLLQSARERVRLRVFDQQQERLMPLLLQGAYRSPSLGEIARQGGIVFASATNDQEALQIALGDQGVVSQLGSGGILVAVSTTSPEVSEHIARHAEQQGCAYLVAAVPGQFDVAPQHRLPLFLSGASEARARVHALLAGTNMHISDLGDMTIAASIAQIAFTLLIASIVEAMGEAAALVEAYGVDRKRFLSLLEESPFFQGAVYERYGTAMIGQRDFSDARFPVAFGLNTIELALKVGGRKNIELLCAHVVYERLLAAEEAGRAEEHWAVLTEFSRPDEQEKRSYVE